MTLDLYKNNKQMNKSMFFHCFTSERRRLLKQHPLPHPRTLPRQQ